MGLCPLEPHRDSGLGGAIGLKSYLTVADMAISMCLAPSMFLRHRESVVETGKMSSVETGQMSAVETGQMTAAETSVLSQQKTSVLSQLYI